MDFVSKEEFFENESFFIKKFLDKKLFIYPTDTIYGIGGVVDKDVILNVRLLKKRFGKPFSIIVPSKKYIFEKFIVKKEFESFLDKKNHTFVLEPKDKNEFPLILSPNGKVGVRILDHWFQKFVEKLGVPIVTTSVNISGFEYLISKEDFDKREFESFKEKIDYFIDDGKKDSPPSSVVDLTGEQPFYLRL